MFINIFLTVYFDIYSGERFPNQSTKRFKSFSEGYELMHIQIY